MSRLQRPRAAITGIRDRLGSIPAAVASALRAVYEWQAEIPDQGRVTLVGLILMAMGLTAVCDWFGIPPLAALVIPGLILTLVGLGFTLRRGGAG